MSKTSISWKSIWIYLKSQIEFWNLKIWFESFKVLSRQKIYFKYGSIRVVPTRTVHGPSLKIFLFQIWILQSGTYHDCKGPSLKIFRWYYFLFRFILNFQISKLDLRFQINSNGFSRHRDSGHKSKYILKEQKLFTFWTMSGGAKYLFSSHCLINNQLIRFISK